MGGRIGGTVTKLSLELHDQKSDTDVVYHCDKAIDTIGAGQIGILIRVDIQLQDVFQMCTQVRIAVCLRPANAREKVHEFPSPSDVVLSQFDRRVFSKLDEFVENRVEYLHWGGNC